MKSLAKNKRALFDYDIKDTFDAGLVLEGREVKSVKAGNVSMNGSYVTINPGSVTLVACHIGPYKYAPTEDYNPTHSRQLLLKKSEIDSLLGKEKGLTVIPLEIYEGRSGLIKLRIGVGRGRKKADKREYLKNRDSDKEIRQATS